ncbi:MAG TPA: PfkB family carbohydrate kinase [Propionicimonas sp.]|nr:PfkB family carbohydrate kinase [Propionicimonas sp.]
MSRLVHLGNAVVDLVLTVPAAPERGGDVLARAASELVGGGFNVMAAASRQGLPVVYAGMHGTGPRGDQVRAALAAEGIGVLQPVLPGCDTGIVVVIVEEDGERSFITAPGAEAQLDAAALARVELLAGDHLYLTGYSLAHASNRAALVDWLPGVGEAVVFFDPGPLVASMPAEALAVVLARADWVSANAAEAAALTGRPDPVEAAGVLQARTRGRVVVRCGPDGCVVALPGADPVVVPGVAAEVVDLNGAGDAHAGAFIAQLAQGVEPLAAAAWGNAAAALAVEQVGPATAPTYAEVVSRLASG